MKPARFLASFFLVVSLGAAEPPGVSPTKPELPEGPLLRAPANYSRWEIITTFDAEPLKKGKGSRKAKALPPGDNSHTQKVVNTKTGRIVHEEVTDVHQRLTDTWFDGGVQYTKYDKDPSWYRTDNTSTGSSAGYHPLPAIGFRGVELITEGNYAGTTLHGEKQCLVFVSGGYQKLDLSGSGNHEKQLKALDMVAYVDVDTRFPIEVRMPGESRVFQFDEPPVQMQTLPTDLTAQIKRGEEGRKRLNQPASRPY